MEPSGRATGGAAAGDGGRDPEELAEVVEEVRASLRDLKHDVRMLKVSMDKQSSLLEL